MSKYATSDLHGCLKSFQALLEKINFSKSDELYILGDLIDRGPDSKGVIDFIWQLQSNNYTIHSLRGNHDQMMLDAQHSRKWAINWLLNGGGTTMDSFDAKVLADIPDQYFHFIKELPYYFEVDEYLLVHAGFGFEKENPLEELHAMLWQRNWYEHINYAWLKNRIIVHGHTPITQAEAVSMLEHLDENKYLDIDTGCVHKGKAKGDGVLACFDLGKRELIFQENLDF